MNLHVAPMTSAELRFVIPIEQRAYSHPWSEQNFSDSLRSGYRIQGLWQAETLLGYSVCMPGVDELHLLNFTVNPNAQGQGLSRVLMEDVCAAAQAMGFGWIWLEVRASNGRAIAVYERFGFERVGERKAYYPLNSRQREDAIVMSLELPKSKVASVKKAVAV